MTIDALLAGGVHAAAGRLLGCTLLRDGVGGVICEVEAYAPDDPASHAFRGRTPRTASMFGPPGALYVYRSYGIHWCANVVCEAEGIGAAVLLRALEPTHGLEVMRERRGVEDPRLLCSGPGRLTQALGIDGSDDGVRLDSAPFGLRQPDHPPAVASTTRIGITRATELPWRYVIAGSSWLSGRRRA